MNELRIGVIGTGGIGRDHIRRITHVITGAKVVAVSDINKRVAKEVAQQYDAKFYDSGEELIASPEVDAVVVTSSDQTHAKYVLACIAAGKYVLCEKPLASTAKDCLEIVKAETAYGKRLVQVGFMRRFDRGYQALKEVIKSGKIGAPLLIHACHRNRSHIPEFTSDMVIVTSGIHEIDISRWLLDEDYESGQVLTGKQNRNSKAGLIDPQIMLLKTKSGVLIDVEVNLCSGYGYDIQCEVVGEKGTVRLPDPNTVLVRSEGQHSYEIYSEWSERFIEAYDIEFQQWVNAVKKDAVDGPSAWDGYSACIAADALIKSRNNSIVEPIITAERPQLYK